METASSCETPISTYQATPWHSANDHNWKFLLPVNLLAPEFIFFILAHPVYKMWVIQETNTLELWNKMHFEQKNPESIYHV